MKSLQVYRCQLVKDHLIDYIGTISCNEDVVNVAKTIGFEEMSEEYFSMFCLNVRGEIIAYHEISHGDLCSSTTHPREIFKRALLNNSGSIVFIHNHPSGDSTPSNADLTTTKRLVECGELLGVPVLDHIIIGMGGEHYSMKAHGVL